MKSLLNKDFILRNGKLNKKNNYIYNYYKCSLILWGWLGFDLYNEYK